MMSVKLSSSGISMGIKDVVTRKARQEVSGERTPVACWLPHFAATNFEKRGTKMRP
jgi:hypothetical protein